MHDLFTCRGGSPATPGAAGTTVDDHGGVLVGAWAGAGGIGWWDDERLRATARPTAIVPLEPGGVVAHRWFEIDAADRDEFLELSTEVWPAFG